MPTKALGRAWGYTMDVGREALQIGYDLLREAVLSILERIEHAFLLNNPTPVEQTIAAALLIPFAIGTTILSGGATIAAVLVLTLMLVIGLLRIAWDGTTYTIWGEK
jgi:hypothetical protein